MKYYAGTVNGKDYGFYLDTKELQEGWVELTEEEHDELIKLNQQGKFIKFEKNKKPVATEYIPSKEELLKDELKNCYRYLKETDYISSKIAEGAATKEEYKKELEKRQKTRDRINEIEKELGIKKEIKY